MLSPEEYAVANNENYQRFLDAGLNVSDLEDFQLMITAISKVIHYNITIGRI